MNMKFLINCLAVAAVLVGWGVAWANQNSRISANRAEIGMLTKQLETVSRQATESEKAIVRVETKIEYILKGVDEIKAEVKSKN